MKTPDMVKTDLAQLPLVQKLRLERINPLPMIIVGAVLLALFAASLFLGGASFEDNDEALERARYTLGQVTDVVHDFRRVLGDQQVQELAIIAAGEQDKISNLQQYLKGRIPELTGVELFGPDLGDLRAADLGSYGFAVLDMLLDAETGLAPMQMHGTGSEARLVMAVRVGDQDAPSAYLLVRMSPDVLLQAFRGSLQEAGSLVLEQYNGRFEPNQIAPLAKPLSNRQRMVWLNVPASLMRIGVVQKTRAGGFMEVLRPVLLILGLVILIVGIALKARPIQAPEELTEDPEPIEALEDETEEEVQDFATKTPEATMPSGVDSGDGLGVIDLPDLGFKLEKPSMPIKKSAPAVELVKSIFRAYDIRGIVGETLDADIARQVGQVVGTLALEQDAAPVVVARDGRDSGPELVQGMIEGIASTGCDVVDIGAVPTGVLYFAAFELGSGTGVMITGSHNPSNYNGFKMVIGGVTQSGDQITAMYDRIQDGSLRLGKGRVSNEEMLNQYRERISSDIQLARPLKLVADCGNGIGGVCAADVLRDIGAEVISLYDEVDGTFPNHHPDPSVPENLEDLIESVKLMDADIGVAFDGDADRLGVVTPSGEIIYSDRLMMLFVKDILSREPGATIIYDVKCTGHLPRVIEEAGGKPMMYKTGHSLIKNKMREVGAPFAGEMSGHFFFKERWYGFDCGIYSAARLLEILAADDRGVEEILSSLPDSVSTPELKVQMEEGENHAFVAEMQEHARFPDAVLTTIDGVRADYEDGWGLVRASNTTPILVVRFDADDEAALKRIQNAFRAQMLAINGELQLPF
ncbi:MAG: phosphomannomutase/phosphoglucomutase [Lysobacterales bacterium]|jgi:phosphomannomutase/phosphoglucomutase